MPDTPPTTGTTPPTCEIRDWPVFVHGFHKGELYPKADLVRMAANFALLSGPAAARRKADGGPFLAVNVKLGHDAQQRMAKSLGFPNVGGVTDCRPGPEGRTHLWAKNVPTTVGAAINAGYVNSGSIEVKAAIPDPLDPSKPIPGPVLTAVSLLGEEQPAVTDAAAPRAVFADGTPVPPMTDPAPWLLAMFEAMKASPAEPPPDPAAAAMTLAFSDTPPTPRPPRPAMPTRDDLNAKLTAMGLDPANFATVSDADLAKLLGVAVDPPAAAGGTDGNPATPFAAAPATPAAPAADPNAPPAWFKSFADDCTRRMGALEAATTAEQKKAADAQMAAFSAEVERAVDDAIRKGNVQPYLRADLVAAGKLKDRAKTFSDGPNKGQTEFAAWAKNLTAGQPSKLLSDAVADGPTPAGTAGPVPAGAARLLRHTDAGQRIIRRRAAAAK